MQYAHRISRIGADMVKEFAKQDSRRSVNHPEHNEEAYAGLSTGKTIPKSV